MKKTAETTKELVQVYNYIIATICKRDQLLEERQVQNKVYKAQVTKLINKRNKLSQELLQFLRSCTTFLQSSATTTKSIKFPDLSIFLGTSDFLIENWLSKIRNKLKANYNYYLTEDIKIKYIEN